MKKYLSVVFLFIFVILLSYSNFIGPKLNADDNFIITAFGDSISAGYGLSDYNNYLNSNSIITDGSYPQVFSRRYKTYFNAKAIGKGVSGHTTDDLIKILESYKNGTANLTDITNFNNTDIFTLCIGANNVLGVATNNVQNYLNGNITLEEFEAMLEKGVQNFKQDYPKILQMLGNKKIIVMTVYNPYKYTSLLDMQINSSLSSILKAIISSVLSSYEKSFQKLLASSMNALQKINDEIRASNGGNIHVVDIWNLFETFNSVQYKNYINADLSKITINSTDTNAIIQDIYANIDPHPTLVGHQQIANEHLKNFKYFELNKTVKFEDLKDSIDEISLNINTFELGEYTYKWYKNENNSKQILQTTTNKSITLTADNFSNGQIYVEVYKNNELIFTTYQLDYNVELNTYSISTQDSLMGEKDFGTTITINVTTPSTQDYNFILYKTENGIKSMIDEGTTEFIVDCENLIGEGELFVEVYKNGTKVYTTNSLSYNITLPTFSISASLDLEKLNEDDNFEITVNTTSNANLKYILLEKSSSNNISIIENNIGIFNLTSNQLRNTNGRIFVEVYKNNTLIFSTNELVYNVEKNTYSISTIDDLTGEKDYGETITINVFTTSTQGYNFILYKLENNTNTKLDEGKTEFLIEVENLIGEGKLFVEVYKNNEIVSTTNSLNYNITMPIFEIITSTNLIELKSDSDFINISISTNSNANSLFVLINKTDQGSIILFENNTGNFNFSSSLLQEDEGELYVEVYINNNLICETEKLDYKFNKEIVTNPDANKSNIPLIVGLFLIGLIGIIGISFAIGIKRTKERFL